MRQPLVVANWKMNLTAPQAVDYCQRLRELLCGERDKPLVAAQPALLLGSQCSALLEITPQVVICPPFTAISTVRDALAGTKVAVGAQNFFPKPNGAYTGEVSIDMLQAAGCQYVIVGHSERRSLFGETAETISLKVKVAVDAGVTPILCVGETMGERSLGLTNKVIGQQLLTCLKLLRPEQLGQVVVAYEPLWAIGSGRSATPKDAAQVAQFVRQKLQRLMDGNTEALRVLYGGSVNPDNMPAFAREPEVDGALVGGASLSADKFAAIASAYGQ
jgi:triosephosphate isomerase